MPPLTSYVRSGPPPQLMQLLQQQQQGGGGANFLAQLIGGAGESAANVLESVYDEPRAAATRGLEAASVMAPILAAETTQAYNVAKTAETVEKTESLRKSQAAFTGFLSQLDGGATIKDMWSAISESADLTPEDFARIGNVLTARQGSLDKAQELAMDQLDIAIAANWSNPAQGAEGHDPALLNKLVSLGKTLGMEKVNWNNRRVQERIFHAINPPSQVAVPEAGLAVTAPHALLGSPAGGYNRLTSTATSTVGVQPQTTGVPPGATAGLSTQGMPPMPPTGAGVGVPGGEGVEHPALREAREVAEPVTLPSSGATVVQGEGILPKEVRGPAGKRFQTPYYVARVDPTDPSMVYITNAYSADPNYPDWQGGLMPQDEPVGEKIEAGDRKGIDEALNAKRIMDQLVDVLRQIETPTGAARQLSVWIPEILDPAANTVLEEGWQLETREIESIVRGARQLVGKMKEGGVLRAEDEKKYKAMLVDIGNQPELARSKADHFRREMENTLYDRIMGLKRAGFNVWDTMADFGFAGVPPHVRLAGPDGQTDWYEAKTTEGRQEIRDLHEGMDYTFPDKDYQNAFEEAWAKQGGRGFTRKRYPR